MSSDLDSDPREPYVVLTGASPDAGRGAIPGLRGPGRVPPWLRAALAIVIIAVVVCFIAVVRDVQGRDGQCAAEFGAGYRYDDSSGTCVPT